jgi:hypothetical protein
MNQAHRDGWDTDPDWRDLWEAIQTDPSIVLFWLGCLLIPFALAFLASPS